MHPDWVRSVRDQCVAAGVPFFFKQWGEWLHESCFAASGLPADTDERAKFFQNTIGRLPETFIDRDMKNAWYRIGKKKAGRLLDGMEWNELPKGGNG